MSRIASERQNLAFGERLAKIRLGRGLNQSDFAESLGLSMRAYANYERGDREAPLAVIRALNEVYGIDPLWMIGGYEEQPVTAKLPVDVGLLVEIAYELDRRLASTGRRLKPGIRKRLIEVAYMACQRDGAVEPARLDELIAVAR